MEKIITGDWDGQPIWRYKTSAEKLLEEIEKNKKLKIMNKEEFDQHDCKGEKCGVCLEVNGETPYFKD